MIHDDYNWRKALILRQQDAAAPAAGDDSDDGVLPMPLLVLACNLCRRNGMRVLYGALLPDCSVFPECNGQTCDRACIGCAGGAAAAPAAKRSKRANLGSYDDAEVLDWDSMPRVRPEAAVSAATLGWGTEAKAALTSMFEAVRASCCPGADLS